MSYCSKKVLELHLRAKGFDSTLLGFVEDCVGLSLFWTLSII